MKKRLSAFLMATILAVSLSPAVLSSELAVDPGGEAAVFYSDVPTDLLCHESVLRLWTAGLLPREEVFQPMEGCTRLAFVEALYRIHQVRSSVQSAPVSDTADPSTAPASDFADVPADSPGADAVRWAHQNGIVNGVSETDFAPEASISREQCCAFLIRFADREGIPLVKTTEPALFQDADSVSKYARGNVLACQMAGLVTGYAGGYLEPQEPLTRATAAILLDRLWLAGCHTLSESEEAVDVGACPALYDALLIPHYDFSAPVQESAPVPVDWFRDAAFIGDSVTVRLQMYCESTKALGDATFLCSTGLSAPTALLKVSAKSSHPSYNGEKMYVEDAVAACGARNIYIMLGINSMRDSLDESTQALVSLIGRIQEKAPDTNILIQSVTPMAATSAILDDSINNIRIEQYNDCLQSLCAEHGWYYLNVAPQFRDDYGNLIPEYCSDKTSMGIHFTAKAARLWVDYLLSHVPEPLKPTAVQP